MLVRQRSFILAALTIVIFFLLYSPQPASIGTWQSFLGQRPTYQRPLTPDDGRFHWSNYRERYPVNRITRLPYRYRRLPEIQHKFTTETEEAAALRTKRQQAVKSAFTKDWKAYKERAWLKDELAPVSGGYRNWFGGWAATLVDTLDTLWIMDLKEDFRDAANATAKIDFTSSDETIINLFETTIRYLGGLLSAYDLSGDKHLLDKSVELGDMLYAAFDTPNRMPITRWDFHKAVKGEPQATSEGALVAEVGSLSLEFTRLSQITQDPKWYDAVRRITEAFDRQQAKTKVPGMWPILINPNAMDFTSDTGFSLGAMADSVYEYFPKMYALLGGSTGTYRKLYKDSMKAAIQYLIYRPMVPDDADILISGTARAESPTEITHEAEGQHLACYAGGMFALGSRLFDIPEHLKIAQKLVDGCVWTYEHTPTGIMPEVFHMTACASVSSCKWDEAAYNEQVLKKAGKTAEEEHPIKVRLREKLPKGFVTISDRRYVLRPEAIESLFVLYRITGDPKLQETAWNMFTVIQRWTETSLAHAGIDDVTANFEDEDAVPPQSDRMESFWMAETLKYFYLIFSEPELISLDEFVLNTEAHPLRRPN